MCRIQNRVGRWQPQHRAARVHLQHEKLWAALGNAVSATLSPAGTGVGARQCASSALRAAPLIPWVRCPSSLGWLMGAQMQSLCLWNKMCCAGEVP